MLDERFPKENRLRSQEDFSLVYREGSKEKTDFFTFYIRQKEEAPPRIGIVTPGKIGNAVKRNRAKRIIRESFRKNKKRFDKLDVVIIIKKKAIESDDSKLSYNFLTFFKRYAQREG